MPIYEYECTECGKRTEQLQRMDDPPLAACPSCGGAVKKLLSAPAVQFKGSGWYVTDYAGRGKDKAAEKGGAAKEGKEGGKEDKPAAAEKAESKPSQSKAGAGSGGGESKSS
jgi:putative FmdB family regulatory protein